jgi:hypothetical protein
VRITPFDLAFGPDAEPRFERIRASMAAGGRDHHDEDGFILDREVTAYLRELVPDEGVGDGVRQHLALLHQAYLYWAEGGWHVRLSTGRARSLLSNSVPDATPTDLPRAFFVQFPERLIWAELAPGEPHEPLDGLFVRPWPEGGFFVLGVFGLHRGRAGFSVALAEGYRPDPPVRESGEPLFTPVMAGGAAAALASIVGEDELIELAARSLAPVAEARACAGASHQPHQVHEV